MNIGIEKVYTICCNYCYNHERIHDSDNEYRWNDTPSRYFRRKGWRHDSSRKNVCPHCRAKVENR